MLTHVADAFKAIAVLAGLAAAGFWWWSARLQAGWAIRENPGLIKLDRKVVTINGRAAALTGLAIAAHALATVLGWLGTLG